MSAQDAGGRPPTPHDLPWPEGTLPDESAAISLVRDAGSDPRRLIAVWHLLDDRIVRGGHAAWGHRVLGHLLADPAGLAGDAITPGTWSAYLTTYAECRMRDRGVLTTSDTWQRAWSGVSSIGEALLRATLMVRVASGGIAQAVIVRDRSQPIDTWIGRLYAVLSDRQLRLTAPAQVAPAIAAVLACVDALEGEADPFAPANPWLERVAMLAADVPRGPERALALACVARLARHRQDVEVARRRFDEAMQVLVNAPERDLVACLHWPRGIHVPCSSALDVVRGMAGLEPVNQTLRRFDALPLLSRTMAANRVDAVRTLLTSSVRSALTDGRAPATDGARRVLDNDLGLPSSVAHVRVLPHAAALALQAIDAGQACAGLAALDTLASALDTCGNGAVADAVRAAHLATCTRLRLPWTSTGGRTTDGAADHGAAMPAGPRGGNAPLSRADRHAYWRTRHAFDESSRLALAAWGRTYLLAEGPDGEGEWARASSALDLVECEALGIGIAVGASGLVAPVPEDWWARHPAHPDLALRLWVRALALGVTRAVPPGPLVACVGARRAAIVAEEEAAVLALRLPTHALRALALARTWYQDVRDVMGQWRVSILQAMTQVRAGATRGDVDARAVGEVHDALAGALAQAAADPLPDWHAVTTRALAELIPSCGAAWVPWLQRAVAVQRWCAHGARPEDVFGAGRGLPLELREWPRQTGT